MKIFGQICAFIIALVATMLARGFVLATMWKWFIVPLGVPHISLWLAVGISMTAGLFIFTSKKPDKDKEYSEILIETVGTCIGYFFALGFGAIVHLFI